MCPKTVKFRDRYFNNIAILILLILLFSYYSFINVNINYRVASSPDENLALFFSNQIIDSSSFIWHSDLNEKYNVNFFKPRVSIDLENNNYIGPYKGFQILLAVSRVYGLIDFIVPITALLGVLSIYVLTRTFFDEKISLLSAVFLGFNPTYIYFANLYYSNIPSVAFALLSLYCFYKGLIYSKNAFYGLAAFFSMYAMFLRTPQIFIFLILVLGLCIAKIKCKKQIHLSNVTALVGTFVGFWSLNFLLNKVVSPIAAPVGGNSSIFYQITYLVNNLPYYFYSFEYYIVLYSPFLFVCALFGFILLYQFEKTFEKRIFLYTSFLTIILFYGLYGFRGETWGFEQVSIESSMARYFIIIYSIFSIYVAVFLGKFLKKPHGRYIVLIVVLLTLTSSILITFNSSNGLLDAKNRIDQYSSINRMVVDNTPENSVIFTKYWDKIFVSDRNIAVYRTNDDFIKQPDLKHFFVPTTIDKDIIPLIDILLSSGIPVYIANDATDLLEYLKQNREYQLKAITKCKTIWKVEKK